MAGRLYVAATRRPKRLRNDLRIDARVAQAANRPSPTKPPGAPAGGTAKTALPATFARDLAVGGASFADLLEGVASRA